jgi:hypothetical protein
MARAHAIPFAEAACPGPLGVITDAPSLAPNGPAPRSAKIGKNVGRYDYMAICSEPLLVIRLR